MKPSVFTSFALITLLAAPALAQDSRPPAGSNAAPAETVVVTGQKPDPSKLDDVVHAFVDAHGKSSPKVNHLPRWYKPVCPEVRNLPAAYGDFIKKRILAIARSVGAPTKQGCEINVEIIFTANPQAIMDEVVKKDPRLLGYHFVHDAENVAMVTAPIQAWYVTSTSNSIKTFLDTPYRGTPPGAPGHIGDGLYSTFNHILILVNTDKIAGFPVGPVADYIAMLSLSQAKAPDDCQDLDSILDYLSDGCTSKPESLTVADKTFLEGLYFMDKTEYGSLQKSNIAEHMQDSLGGK